MSPPRRILIQMSGAPGSGKSTLARNLAQSLNGTVISHDLIRSFFLTNDMAFEQSARLAYDLQWTLAKDLIEQGQMAIIIDSTCNYQQTLDQGETLARLHDYEYSYVECRVDDLDLLDARLQSRVAMRSQRTAVSQSPLDAPILRHGEDSHALFQRWIDHPCRPAGNTIIVDSTRCPKDCLDYTMMRLAKLD
ncbi:hypothetical protein PVAG01_07482 [Phlyctema vagabunda]|uniref:ATP-binding protein n=1 Tax=Phlyctema vagabunda TaxID=108571 RepID=A0ABR4PCK1_9HELO